MGRDVPIFLIPIGVAAGLVGGEAVSAASPAESAREAAVRDVVQAARAERAASAPAPSPSSAITLEAGEIRNVAVDQVTRVAIGDPNVVDITVVSPNELLLQARTAGTTNLIVWDRQGQRTSMIDVVDRAPETLEPQLRRLLQELSLPKVDVKREQSKLFLVGEVPIKEDLDRLEQMLSAFPKVTNLVRVTPGPPPVPVGAPQPLIKLSVQVLEMSRTDVEKLGVSWSQSVKFTESAPGAASLGDTIFKIGQTVSRDSLTATLNALVQKKRARVLSEPKLVTTSGKEASSFIGVERPIVTATSFGTTTSTVSTSIEYRKTGVLLKMTPNIYGEGKDRKITTVMEAEVSGVDSATALSVPVGSQTVNVPSFTVRKANTQVITAPGQSVIIAGLLEAEDTNNVDQVPALGSIPVLGRLFRSPDIESTQREVIIVVTPDLLADDADKAAHVEDTPSPATLPPPPADASGDPVLRYAQQVQARVAASLRYPPQEAGKSGHVRLRLHVVQDGALAEALVSEPSGVPRFDQEALSAARRQAPYPPIPSELGQPDLWLELPVLFGS